jgi:uncharacterized membrane protein YozB (DUF420 family)
MGANVESVLQEGGTRKTTSRRFAPWHAADAIFFPALLAFLWLGILAGFVPEIVDHIARQKPPYLWIVHVHAVFFAGWLVLLTIQMGLVRARNLGLHRRMGRMGFYLLPIMLVLGFVTSVMVDRLSLAHPGSHPQFLSIQLSDLVSFGILVPSALYLRGDSASHKRLMILATTSIANAGFIRWWGPHLSHWLGDGYFSFLSRNFSSDFLIIGTMIVYDIVTRGRPNRALLFGGSLVVGIETLAVFLYFDSGWTSLAVRIIRP